MECQHHWIISYVILDGLYWNRRFSATILPNIKKSLSINAIVTKRRRQRPISLQSQVF